MKQRHKAAIRLDATEILKMLGLWPYPPDFFTLRNDQVCRLLEEADRVKYQKPSNANGSRARYFYARLLRLANMKC